MKTRAITSLMTVFAGCTLVFAQSKFVVEDDIYYQPNETNKVVETKKAANQTQSRTTQTRETYTVTPSSSNSRDVDEYNRRYSQDYEETEYQDTTADDAAAQPEVIYVNPEEGYYLNGFTGSNSDYEYAERIRKFHNPKFTIHLGDPAFTDIYFLNSMDWNVYIDNNYAWVTPTWTNPWYWNYMWSPFSYSSLSWRWNSWGWGWNSWGWGGFYDPFWGPSWGHHYPHWGHGGYPNWGHGGYPNWGGHRPNYRPNNVNGTSPRNPYYGRGDGYTGNRRPGTNTTTRPGTTITTRPSTSGDRNDQGTTSRPNNNSNIRPGNIRPGNVRPSTRPATENGSVVRPSTGTSSSSRPSTGTGSTVRPSRENGTTNSTTRPSGNYTRPSRNNNSGSSSDKSYSRPSSSESNSSSRPSYNSGSDNRNSGSSSGYGGGRSSGGSSSGSGSGGRGGRR